jgi:TetR/AcrR family transcriptional regulator, mexCD-oprJ operon repressor
MPITCDPGDDALLRQLATALVEKPRATLQELAKGAGVSKATLYRFCRTRDELLNRMIDYGSQLVSWMIKDAALDTAPIQEALRRLIENHLAHRELTAFLIHYLNQCELGESSPTLGWTSAMDAFFLRGQQEGVFRIDIPTPALSDLFMSMLLGAIESERRGRIARASIGSLIERLFLQGATQQ